MKVPWIHLSLWRADKILSISFCKPLSTHLVLLLPHDSIDSDTTICRTNVLNYFLFFKVVSVGSYKSQFSFSLICIIICENFFSNRFGGGVVFYRREYVLLEISFRKFTEQGRKIRCCKRLPFLCACAYIKDNSACETFWWLFLLKVFKDIHVCVNLFLYIILSYWKRIFVCEQNEVSAKFWYQ